MTGGLSPTCRICIELNAIGLLVDWSDPDSGGGRVMSAGFSMVRYCCGEIVSRTLSNQYWNEISNPCTSPALTYRRPSTPERAARSNRLWRQPASGNASGPAALLSSGVRTGKM
jgi:hypothetical protein